MLLPFFNIIVAASVASPKSIFKKILSLGFLLFLAIIGIQDYEFVNVLIYFCAVIYAFVSSLTLNKKIEITEGGEDNE